MRTLPSTFGRCWPRCWTHPAADPGVVPATHSAVIDAEAYGALLTSLDGTGRCELLHAPSVLINEFQRANISTIQQRSYVTGFEPEGTKDQPVFSPVVDVLQLGVTLDAAATLLPDDGIGLRLVADHRELVEMLDKAWSPHHPDLKIQAPDIHRGRVDAWATIPDDHCAVYAVPNQVAGTYLLVMARAAAVR